LPSGTLWADRNVGASEMFKKGKLYAWAESESKSIFDWTTYFDRTGSAHITQAKKMYEENPDFFILKIVGTPKRNNFAYINNRGTSYITKNMDCAQKYFGDEWTLPQEKHFKELIDNCSWTWVDYGKECGYWIKGVNGNKIFLPTINSEKNIGVYWSFTLHKDASSRFANCLIFDERNHEIKAVERCLGLFVRPIVTINNFGERVGDGYLPPHTPEIKTHSTIIISEH